MDEARASIGRKVVYRPRPDRVEEGEITSVNDWYVFVRYGGQLTSAATRAQDLEFIS